MLSQAGRVVLIKATLQSLLVFYMSTTKIPTRVLNVLVNLIRRFFWGKKNHNQYLAYVAWDQICRPVNEGGLGIKDLATFNDDILMKYLWRLAQGSDSQWAQLMRAKYISRSLLWQSKRNYKCTIMLGSLMNLRGRLLPMLRWKLGDGRRCHALGEPWIQGAV